MREFRFNGQKLADPDDEMTPDQVRVAYSATHPALTNATIEGPKTENGVEVYTFTAAVKTKG